MIGQLAAALADVPELAGGRLCVADCNPAAPAGHFAEAIFQVPRIDDPDYVPALLALCEGEGIRVLLPLIDPDQVRLAPHLEDFEACGTALVCPGRDLVELTVDKLSFDAFAENHGIPVPRTWAPEALDGATYPLFFKPRRGFGSRDTGLARDAQEARLALARNPDLEFQEWLPVPEISVDAFVSRSGDVLHAVQRLRDKVVGGEAVLTHTIRLESIGRAASRVLEALAGRGFHGPANLQFFLAEEPLLFDVNLRLGAGGATLSNMATGGHFFRAILAEACGRTAGFPERDYTVDLWVYKFLGDLFLGPEGIPYAFPERPENQAKGSGL